MKEKQEKYLKKAFKVLEMYPRKSTPIAGKSKIKSLFYKNKDNSKSNTSIEKIVNIIIC